MVPSATWARLATSRICTASYPPSVARARAASRTRARRAAWLGVSVPASTVTSLDPFHGQVEHDALLRDGGVVAHEVDDGVGDGARIEHAGDVLRLDRPLGDVAIGAGLGEQRRVDEPGQ